MKIGGKHIHMYNDLKSETVELHMEIKRHKNQELHIKKLIKTKVRNEYNEFSISLLDDQNLIKFLDPGDTFTIKFDESKHHKRVGAIFDNSIFSIESDFSTIYPYKKNKKIFYNLRFRKVDIRNSTYIISKLQDGSLEVDGLLEKISDNPFPYYREYIISWVALYGELLHEKYNSLKAPLLVLYKLSMLNAKKEEKSRYNEEAFNILDGLESDHACKHDD